MDLDDQLSSLINALVDVRTRVDPGRSVLAAITGIDGCGKGYVATSVASALQARGLRVANVNIDGWLNLPHVRFADVNPGQHFFQHAIRFDELFSTLVLPLRDKRSVQLTMNFAEETAARYRKHEYRYVDIDVIVLEGIYLLKRELRDAYDLSCWIDCSFDTALERAIARAQEGLPAEETIKAYRTIYFPAQEIHAERDEPRQAASFIIKNLDRLR